MEYESLLKQYRRKPIAKVEDLGASANFTPLDYGRDAIERIIPHREPFLLVDRLTGVDLTESAETVFGERFIDPADPVFLGHFPGYPVYPGALQFEMSGQLGLCLTYFVVNQSNEIAKDASPVRVMVTRVHGGIFLEPLLPGVMAKLVARKLEYDGYFGTVLSQVMSGDKICSVSIAEVIFMDE
jgi:3-hydroxymyristoyl/3-hydroxydecanoyl-(acyl carrier protein) dehydratase